MTERSEIPDGFLRWRTRPRGKHAPSLPDVPAQALYGDFIKNGVSPTLRNHGFSGSGGRYSLKSDSHWALLGFQKSWYSDKAEVRFTVNLLVVRRDVWSDLVVAHPYYGATPSAITLYGPPVRSTRIGKLVDDHEDKWWRVYAGQNMGMLRADVIANVVDAGLPWLREQIASTEQGRA